VLVVLEERRGSLDVNEQVIHFADVLLVDLRSLTFLGNEVGCRDQVDGVTQGALLTNLC